MIKKLSWGLAALSAVLLKAGVSMAQVFPVDAATTTTITSVKADIVAWGVVQGAVSVPQQAHVGTGAAGLAFDAEGDVLGYVSMDFDESDSAGASGRQNPRMLLTSATRLASATQRAKTLLDSE